MPATTVIPSSSSSSMGDKDGVKGMVEKVKAEEKDILSVMKMVDPIRELGLDLEQRQYNTRLEAFSDPRAYAAKRQSAFDEMVVHIRKSYEDAFSGFIEAGMPTEMAKNAALAAAANEKAVRRQVIETQFPTGANFIGDMASIKAGGGSVMNFAGGAQTPARRAPARRRAAPRKKRAAPRRPRR